jgi:hypothetical protein
MEPLYASFNRKCDISLLGATRAPVFTAWCERRPAPLRPSESPGKSGEPLRSECANVACVDLAERVKWRGQEHLLNGLSYRVWSLVFGEVG